MIYQRLDFSVVAQREVKNFLFSVIMPTAALCVASLSIFAIEVSDEGEGLGDRLSILFTIILAIIANSIATQGRLPRVDYFTWADYSLYTMQFLVYLVVVETSSFMSIAAQVKIDIRTLDRYLMYLLMTIFGVTYVILGASGLELHHRRALKADHHFKRDKASFWVEEERLFYVENGVRHRFRPGKGAYTDEAHVEVNVHDAE
jgi:hypothetical protein